MTFSQPTTAGLYDSSLEKDSCGVGFIVNILHSSTHDIVRDASTILCNMIHRGGGPIDDGDGAGVMTAIPHKLLVSIYPNRIIQYQYAFGNIFFSRDEAVCQESKNTFQEIALRLGLTIIAWRECPVDNSRLGPISKSKEPVILQPIICFSANQNVISN